MGAVAGTSGAAGKASAAVAILAGRETSRGLIMKSRSRDCWLLMRLEKNSPTMGTEPRPGTRLTSFVFWVLL